MDVRGERTQRNGARSSPAPNGSISQLARCRNAAQRAEHHVVGEHPRVNLLEDVRRALGGERGAKVERAKAALRFGRRNEAGQTVEFVARIEQAFNPAISRMRTAALKRCRACVHAPRRSAASPARTRVPMFRPVAAPSSSER